MVKNEENDECEMTGKVRTHEQTLHSEAFPGHFLETGSHIKE